MACKHPIWIRNRRYFDKKRPRVGFRVDDDHKSSLALRPWDISRQWLLVPCGKCEDCLRRQRNDWFVRLERELARCKAEHHQAIFITITIAPRYYEKALLDPSWFIRKFNERIRHKLGHSFKHAFFQEFGTHPEVGNQPRLHFHGFLFQTDALYNTIRSAVGDLGHLWLAKASLKRARYVVKYVTKQIQFNPADVAGQFVKINGKDTPLSVVLQHRRYTRKFISARVGDYLGNFRRPSRSVYSWDYLDSKTSIKYSYGIPRYYLKYLSETDQIIRSIRSADSYARFSKSSLVKYVVDQCVKAFLPSSALSFRNSIAWEFDQFCKFCSGNRKMPPFDPPVWLSRDIIDFWRNNFKLQIT